MCHPQNVSITVEEDEAGQRIDTLIASRIPDCSRSFAASLVRQGILQVDSKSRKPGYRLRPGDHIHGIIPPPAPSSCEPEPIDLNLLHEDADLLVVNKPPGLVVHPAPGHAGGTLVNALLYHCPDLTGVGGERRPGIVHRLDKDTSGVLVVAKNGPALKRLAAQFKSRTIRKLYLGLVHGDTATPSGRIDLPVGRHPVDRKRMSTRSPRGRAAETRWHVHTRLPETTLLTFDLRTGRTHQIRVHAAAAGFPLVGDPVYCGNGMLKRHSRSITELLRPVTRQMLHAWRIRLHHPTTGQEMAFEAAMPPDMNRLVQRLTEAGTEHQEMIHGAY